MKFNGRQFEAGDAIERDYIMDVQPQKLGTLLRTRYIEVDPVTRPVDKMTKAELVEYAADLGVEVSSSWRKDEILEAVKEAPHGS